MSQKIIIFDSPDGTGKTNIAKGLSGLLGVPYFKYHGEHDYWREKKFKTALEFDQPFMMQYLQQTASSVIWDRAWPSEWVYSNVFERETNHALLIALDNAYAKMGAWIIVPMRRDYRNNETDEVVPFDKMDEIHDAYDCFCNWTKCNTIRVYVDSFHNVLVDELTAITSVIKFPPSCRQTIILENR